MEGGIHDLQIRKRKMGETGSTFSLKGGKEIRKGDE